MRVAGPTPNMSTPAPAQLPVAEACPNRIRASLRPGGRLTKARPTHCHLRCARLLLPRPSAVVLCHPPSASDSAPHSEPASSVACPAVCRTPRGSARSLRIQTPADLLRRGFDVADAVFLIPHSPPSHFSIRMAQFIDGFTLTLTVEHRDIRYFAVGNANKRWDIATEVQQCVH